MKNKNLHTLRVLHLPTNIASIPSHTVRGLRAIGLDVRGLMLGGAANQNVHKNDGVTVVDGSGANVMVRFFKRLPLLYFLLRDLLWADVVHWYFVELLPVGLDLKLVKWLRKPAVIEWLGSEIRIPEVEFTDNPFYRDVFERGVYEYPEKITDSLKRQKLFLKNGFIPIVSGMTGTTQYLNHLIFKKYYIVNQRLYLKDYDPLYPSAIKDKPLIVHSPTAPYVKGTPYVMHAIEELCKEYDFEFVLLQNMPHKEAADYIRNCDIFLDQFVLGAYGMASIEAMAFGKPVLCYIKSSLLPAYPVEMPIINTNPNDLYSNMERLLLDGELRNSLGRKGRQYVENHHDSEKLALQLVSIYEQLSGNTN